MMFDEAAKILKCTVFPAGGENSDMQAEIMSEINATGSVSYTHLTLPTIAGV